MGFDLIFPYETPRFPFDGRRPPRARSDDRRPDPAARRGACPRNGLKLGTVTYNIAKDWDLPTLIKNLTEIGFDGVELRTTHKHGVEICAVAGGAGGGAQAVRGLAGEDRRAGHDACEYHSPDPAVVRKNIDETKQWVTLAQDLGSPSVKVSPNGLPKEVPEEKTLEQIGKSLARVRRLRASENGVTDPARGPRRRDLTRAAHPKILDYGGNHPGVRVCWNSNQTDLLDGGFDANFKLLKDQIGQVHMRDLYLEEYPWRALITQSGRDELPGLLLRRDPGVDRWRPGPALFQGVVPGVSRDLTLPAGSRGRGPAAAHQRICLARSLIEKTRLAKGSVLPSEGSATSTVSSGFKCSVDLNQRAA